MKNISIKDEWGDELEFEEVPNGIAVVTRTKDAEETLRVGMVVISEAQGRELYLWLAKAIGVIQ